MLRLKSGRGGKRDGSGKPKGHGKYGCRTVVRRVPAHLWDKIEAYIWRLVKSGNNNVIK